MEKWTIDSKFEEIAKVSITENVEAVKKWGKFRDIVTTNPFYHPKPKRIKKMIATSYPLGTYRYRDDPLRVVYYPEKKERVVYPLEAGTATNISYKKRSKR